MLTLILSGILGVALMLGLGLTDTSAWGWAVFFGVLAFLACNTAVGLMLKKRIKSLMDVMQGTLMTGQKQMQEKMNAWKFRPPGSPKQAQIEMQKMQHVFVEKALAQSEAFEPYYKWVPLLSRQITTLRMQLHYQDRNWKEVDALLPKCIVFDPMTAAMAMARTYMRDGYHHEKDKKDRPKPNDIDRRFERGSARLRYGQGALLFGLYAWIQNQSGDPDAALETLLRADRKMENATIKRNIELLRNNKPKQFSLAGLGDEWYALGLEEPRMRAPRSHEKPF